jgi:hypothetical protein
MVWVCHVSIVRDSIDEFFVTMDATSGNLKQGKQGSSFQGTILMRMLLKEK